MELPEWRDVAEGVGGGLGGQGGQFAGAGGVFSDEGLARGRGDDEVEGADAGAAALRCWCGGGGWAGEC